MTTLSKGGLVDGQHGKGGGYRLLRKPEEYSLGEILRLTEGSLAPVACLEEGATRCEHPCPTLPVWEKLERLVDDYLNSVKLSDLLPKP
jgi:Rrf2 family protein